MPKLPLRSALRSHWGSPVEDDLGFPVPLFALLLPILFYLAFR
jgi:hypothetical protein